MADDQPSNAHALPPPILSFLLPPPPFWQIPLPHPNPNPNPQSHAQKPTAASMLQLSSPAAPAFAHPGGGHVAIPSHASVSGLHLFAESPESTLLDPQSSPPPPTSGQMLPLEMPALRPRLLPVAPLQTARKQQREYPSPLAAHEDVVADAQLFLDTLAEFHAFLGTQLLIPNLEGVELDLHLLYCQVTAQGGLEQVIKLKRWSYIVTAFDFPRQVLNQPYFFRKHYSNLLHHYEQVYFFRRDGQLVPLPVPLPLPNSVSTSQFHEQQTFHAGEHFEQAKKRQKTFVRNELPRANIGKLMGQAVTGAIDGKCQHGYLVTVRVGTEKLRGILYYEPVVNTPQQFAAESSEPVNDAGVQPSSFNLPVGQTQKKRGRDPNAPRVNKSGYNYFFAEQRTRLKSLRSENLEVTRLIGDMWQRLTPQEKMPYLERGKTDKERYIKQKEEYRERMKMQLQQTQGDRFSEGFPESAHDTGHAPNGLEGADQDRGYHHDAGHDYHVSLDADLDGGETNSCQDQSLQNQIYNIYVSGDQLSYSQEDLNYISENKNHGQKQLECASEKTVPSQEVEYNAAGNMVEFQKHSECIPEKVVSSQDDGCCTLEDANHTQED